MQGFCAPFEGKDITLMGLGVLGRGVGDAEFLATCGARVIVTDIKTEGELAESVARLKKYANVECHLGGHRVEDFTQCDMVIKAAGVPLHSAEIAAAAKAGVPVYMSTALCAKYAMDAGAIVVGITGTRGKSTVAAMIYHSVGKTGRRVHLGGNVRGTSTLAMLPQIEKGDILVLELDSWQLQGFGDLRVSPQVAVFTNLMPDHMNYYLPAGGQTAEGMERYFADKANIFHYQKNQQGVALLVGASVCERIRAARSPLAPTVPPAIPADWRLQVIGEHNRENASLAAAALRVLGLSEAEVRSGLESFEPVEGRLQLMREVRGVQIYNDNNATTPEATIAALEALGGGTVLIVGGSDKGLALDGLVSAIRKNASGVILLAHDNYTGSVRLAEALAAAALPYKEARSVGEALRESLADSKGGNVLFSPAFASFGMFKNEYDRNDQFVASVRAL